MVKRLGELDHNYMEGIDFASQGAVQFPNNLYK